MEWTRIDLLRGWSVLAGLVPLFALLGSSGPAGATIAAAVLLVHVLAIGDLRGASWIASVAVSLWPAVLAVALVVLGADAAEARPRSRRLPLVEHAASAPFLAALFPPWWGRRLEVVDAGGPLEFSFVGSPPVAGPYWDLRIDAERLLAVWIAALSVMLVLSLLRDRLRPRERRLRLRPR